MFQVIAVDDEPASLRRLERLLAGESQIDKFELFNNAYDALDYAKENPVNLALLDMEMPGKNGLTLAEELQAIYPNLDIIFITAYNQYALDAFSVHASGYLLKPVSSNDFKKELDTIIGRHSPLEIKPESDKILVTCFGSFSCRLKSTGEMIRFRTVKAEELFILLLDGKNCLRSKDFLLDTLWPEVDDPEKVGNNFRVTCSYLRKAFSDAGFPNIMLRSKEDYYLNLEKIDCDLLTFRNAIDHYQTLNTSDLKKIVSLYKGAYLENKFYDWSYDSKNWLEKNCIKMMHRVYEDAMEAQDYSEADSILQNMLSVDPYDEQTMELSMKVKILVHNYQAARDAYQAFSDKMFKDLGESPSDHLRKFAESI